MGEEDGGRALPAAAGRARAAPLPHPALVLLFMPRLEIKDEITQVKTTALAKVGSFSTPSASRGVLLMISLFPRAI